MNPFKQIKEQGASDEELLELLHEKLHEEKLWLLRQPAIIPGLFRKRLSKLLHLVEDHNASSDTTIKISENTDKEGSIYDYKNLKFHDYLAQYDAYLNAFRLEFMNAEGVDEMTGALKKMIALEEHYYDLVDEEFDLDTIEYEEVPPNEKLEAFRMLEHVKAQRPGKTEDLLKELKRIKRILRVYHKTL